MRIIVSNNVYSILNVSKPPALAERSSFKYGGLKLAQQIFKYQFQEKVLYMKEVLFFIPKSILKWTGPTRPDPARPGTTVTLFEALYLRKSYRYGFQTLTQYSHTV